MLLNDLPPAPTSEAMRELAERVKNNTDLRTFLADKLEDARDFGRYTQARCMSPDHSDTSPSALYFADGAHCTGCGWRADIIDFYRADHPELDFATVCETLLADDTLHYEGGDIDTERRPARQLDPDLPARYHFRLVSNPALLGALIAYGMRVDTIQRYQLGAARVLVRLAEKEVDEDTEVEWREVNGISVPYQWQDRYSVPVFVDGALRQIIYRKSSSAAPGPKTTVEKDAGNWLFGQDELADATTAIICSGWSDKLVLAQWGITAVTSCLGDGSWSAEWDEHIGNVRRLYSLEDADAAGLKKRARLKERFGYIRPIELPYQVGSKKDVRDYMLEGKTAADFKRLMKQADNKQSVKVLYQ